jgi:structural maintenance of chromosomes protein 6
VQNKRPRHSPSNASEDSSSDDSGNEASVASDNGADNALEAAQDEEQMVWATQQVQRDFRSTANKQNTATDSGIIEEIQCINFMCHEHLTVSLGPLINFIIGHNGSGKSAVLTALTICLGGKATATNRAQNLKSLIKEGKDHCIVQVRIKNQGALAYKPDQYGASITVERHFNRSGTTGFKLRDLNGRIVSTKKAELEDILDAFSMQIDNPMNVLTQDMARQFLNHSTPKDKYKFFLQGTQLEVLSKDYQQIEQSLELMNTRAEVKKSDIRVLRKKMEDLAVKARRAENLERMRAKEAEIAHQALWANVQEEEAELAEADNELEKVSAVIERRQGLVDAASEAYERSDSAYEAAKQRVTEVSSEMEPAREQAQEQKAVFDDSKKRLLALLVDERKAVADVKVKETRVDDYKNQIENLRRLQAEADDGLHAEKIRQVEDARIKMEAARATFSAHENELPSLIKQLKADQVELQTADQKVQKARAEEQSVKARILSLQSGERRWLEGYSNPHNLERLLRAIGADSRFREKPVGPMGRHVKLLRSEWASILEKQFGASLNGFVVTSRADQSTLSDLMRKCNWMAPVFIGKRDAIDTTAHEPPSKLLTWMRALKIEDSLVRNQLIINQAIEQTVLIEARTEGYRFMDERGPETRHVKQCFTFSDGNKRKGRVINYASSGGLNDSPIDEYKGALRMQADKADQIKEEEARLTGVQQELNDLEQAAASLQNRLNASKRQEQDHVRQQKRLKLAYQQASDTVGRLEDELSKATPDAAAIDVLQESLGEAQEALVRAEGVFEDMVLQRDKLNTEQRQDKKKLEDAQAAVKDLEFKLNKAQTTVRKYQGQREDDLKKKNQAIAQVTAAEENKAVWEEERRKVQAEVDSLTRKAEEECPVRVAVPQGKTAEELGYMLQKLGNTRRETEKELGGSQEQLLRAANEAKRIHQEARIEFESLESLKTVSERADIAMIHFSNVSTASYQHSEQPSSTMAAVPIRHLCSSACHVQLPAQ